MATQTKSAARFKLPFKVPSPSRLRLPSDDSPALRMAAELGLSAAPATVMTQLEYNGHNPITKNLVDSDADLTEKVIATIMNAAAIRSLGKGLARGKTSLGGVAGAIGSTPALIGAQNLFSTTHSGNDLTTAAVKLSDALLDENGEFIAADPLGELTNFFMDTSEDSPLNNRVNTFVDQTADRANAYVDQTADKLGDLAKNPVVLGVGGAALGGLAGSVMGNREGHATETAEEAKRRSNKNRNARLLGALAGVLGGYGASKLLT